MLKHEWSLTHFYNTHSNTYTQSVALIHTQTTKARTFRQTVKNMTPYFRFPYADNNGRQYGAAYAQK